MCCETSKLRKYETSKSRNTVLRITESMVARSLSLACSCATSKLKYRMSIMHRLFTAGLIGVAVIVVFELFPAVHAAQKGSENKGRYYFRQTCKECHTKGAVGGEITPLMKTMAEWRVCVARGGGEAGEDRLAKYLPADEIL